MDDELFSYKDTARTLKVPESTLRSLVAKKRIPHVRLSPRLVRFSRRALERWLAERAQVSR